MTDANNINEFLSQADKIDQLTDQQVEDLYARQVLLSHFKDAGVLLMREDIEFQGLDMSQPVPLISALQQRQSDLLYNIQSTEGDTIEEQILNRYTKDQSELENDKVEILRHKLKVTSECCGVPRSILLRNNLKEVVD
jgi:hypothetical protein